MTKSKSKARSVRTPCYFVAVHQDQLMEAFSRGFVSPQAEGLIAEASVTQRAIERAKCDQLWGDVVLVEVAGSDDGGPSKKLLQPLLLTEVVACWTRSADVKAEIDARLETFDDTIPAVVEIKVDPKLFPQASKAVAQEALPLVTAAGDGAVEGQDSVESARDAIALEKIAGAVSMIRSCANQALVPLALVEQILTVPRRDGAAEKDVIKDVATHVYRVLRPSQLGSADEQIFVVAADRLLGASPKLGIEPISFVEQLGGDEESKAFVDTLSKVMDNRIELSDSKLDDTGMVGQRALLVFLLAPRVEELERWLRARPVGQAVSMLASMLAGLYCGLGGISRNIKGPGASALLGAVDVARALQAGETPTLRVERKWDSDARLEETLSVGSYELMGRATQPPVELATLLVKARNAGLQTMVDPKSGELSVSNGGAGALVGLSLAASTMRVPPSTITRLTFAGRPAKRGQLSKEMVSALLDESLRPAVANINAAGEVCLTVEMDATADFADGMSSISRVVDLLGLVQDSKASKKAARTGKVGTAK